MPDITKIIEAFDEELERSGKTYLAPPEANLLLQRKNLLKDNPSRPGLPLRNILRSGGIPHAYQLGSKGSEWRIPHSSNKRNIASNYSTHKFDKYISVDKKSNFEDIKIIHEEISEARAKHKPDIIKYLLIAEAPPDDVSRFFYYSDVKDKDWLFLGVMQALYPESKQNYLIQNRESRLKTELLENFKKEGFYLIDLLDYPISFNSLSISEMTMSIINKVKCLANENTKIILIKASVYDLIYQPLRNEGFSVIDMRIDFPASGGQQKFQDKFKEALIEAGYF